MRFNHPFADRHKSGVINTDDDASDSNLDDRVEQNSGYVPRLVNLNYAPTALHAFAAGQEPIPQADYPSISSNFIATTSAESPPTMEGFSNVNTDLAPVPFSPPDTGLAISGGGYIISVVNDIIGWTPNFSTPMQFEAFSQFFSSVAGAQTFFFDPQVLYDASNGGRFIVTEDSYSTQSNILIAVSHDAFLISNEYAVDPSHWGTSIADVALLTQMVAGFQDGFDNGSGGYTASPTSEAIFGEAPLLAKSTT